MVGGYVSCNSGFKNSNSSHDSKFYLQVAFGSGSRVWQGACLGQAYGNPFFNGEVRSMLSRRLTYVQITRVSWTPTAKNQLPGADTKKAS